MTSPLTIASREAMAYAQAYRAHILRTPSPLDASERLQRRAARAARSPLALDQVFAHCLDAMAHGRGPAETSPRERLARPDALEQMAIRETVLKSPATAPSGAALAAIVAAEELRGGRVVGRGARKLAEHLRQAAALARELWDHPALLASPKVRAALLIAAPALERRAEVLSKRPTPHDRLIRPRSADMARLGAI